MGPQPLIPSQVPALSIQCLPCPQLSTHSDKNSNQVRFEAAPPGQTDNRALCRALQGQRGQTTGSAALPLTPSGPVICPLSPRAPVDRCAAHDQGSCHPSTCGLGYMVIVMGFPAEGSNRSWSNKVNMLGRFFQQTAAFWERAAFSRLCKGTAWLAAACSCVLSFPTPVPPPTSPVLIFLPFLPILTHVPSTRPLFHLSPHLSSHIRSLLASPIPVHRPPTPAFYICLTHLFPHTWSPIHSPMVLSEFFKHLLDNQPERGGWIKIVHSCPQ